MTPALTRRMLRTLLVLGGLVAVAGASTWSAFSDTSTSAGNTMTAGDVKISDNDAGTALLALTNAKPGDSSTGCIRTTYTGSLAATVRLYGQVSGALAPYLNLTVTRGSDPSPSYPSCTSFTADTTNYTGAGAGVVFSGLLSAYPASYAAAIEDAPGAPETWTLNEARSYRFSVTLGSDVAGQNQTATAAFTFEARNQ